MMAKASFLNFSSLMMSVADSLLLNAAAACRRDLLLCIAGPSLGLPPVGVEGWIGSLAGDTCVLPAPAS